MTSEELPIIATKDAQCHIDFEFQMAYHDPLNSRELISSCIVSALNDVLGSFQNNEQVLSINESDISIPEIDLRPNESNPRRIKVGGWITCQDLYRQKYIDALQLAQQSRKISKQMAERTNIKGSKIQIQSFQTKFSNAHHVNKSFIDGTEVDMKKYMKSHSVTNTIAATEQKTDYAQNQDDGADQPPLHEQASVIVNPNITNDESVEVNVVDSSNNNEDANNNGDDYTSNNQQDQPSVTEPQPASDEEYVDVLSKQSTNDNDSSFEKIEVDNGDDQSSNEEQKTLKQDNLYLDTKEVDNISDDYTNVTPRIPGADVSPLPSMMPYTTKEDDDEVSRLRTEISTLKMQHKEQLTHFQNKMSKLKREKEGELRKQKSRMSMQIDDEIVTKQINQDHEDQIYKLQSQLTEQSEQTTTSIKQLRLQHSAELQKIDFKFKQTQQLHTLELSNITNQHKFETDQLQSQIRALTGSLERESQKDRKIHELTEENEKLKADQDRTSQNYEVVIQRLNSESEENIQNEIDKRVRETAQLGRQVRELKQSLKREQSKQEQLTSEVKQLKNQIEQKNQMVTKLQNLYAKKKTQADQLQRKVLKSKRNVVDADKDKQHEKEKKILDQGGHVRKKSNIVGRHMTVSKLDTGEKVFVIEKNKELDITQLTAEQLIADGMDHDDLDIHTDSEYEDDEKEKKTVLEEEHNAEIELKDKEIAGLKQKVKDLEQQKEVLTTSTKEDINNSQQKIGSLQQRLQQEQENWMTEKEKLQYKLQQKESHSKNVGDKLKDFEIEHKRQIRELNYEIDQVRQEMVDKDDKVRNLEEHVDFLASENQRLKEFEQDIEDYELELEELDNFYQEQHEEISKANKQMEEELEQVKLEKDTTEKTAQTTIHKHRETILQLQQMVDTMQQQENDMKEKREQLIMLEKEKASSPSTRHRQRASRELNETDVSSINDNNDIIDNNQQRRPSYPIGPVLDTEQSAPINDEHADRDDTKDDGNWRGQMQADPQPEPSSPSLALMSGVSNISNMSDYVRKEEMEEMIMEQLAKQKDEIAMKNALAIDTVKSREQQKYNKMEQELKGNIDTLNNNNQELNRQLQESQNALQQSTRGHQQQMEAAEESRIRLLKGFMKEMDRMRDEIKKLNGIRNGNIRNGRR